MPDELDALIDPFVAKLAELGYAPNPGASPVVLDRLESENGWKFPDAIRRYLLKANGCANGMMFASKPGFRGIWTFPSVENWSAHYLGDASTELLSRGYVGFSDALIVAPTYGICLNQTSGEWGRIKIFDAGWEDSAYIDSFEEFAAAWVMNPDDNLFECMIG